MRGYRNYTVKAQYTSIWDRIFSGLSCLTYGMVGFIWLIASHIRKESLNAFSRFHVFQSIIFFIGLYVLGIIFNILLGFAQIMPFIGPFFANIAYFFNGYPLLFGFSATQLLIEGTALYMAICAFTGREAEVPGLSDTVRKMI